MSAFWDKHAKTIDPENFRAPGQYLSLDGYDYRGIVDHLETRGVRHLIALLGEDDSFGCVTEQVGGLTVSRDLLDSIVELDVLRMFDVKIAGIFLDIGAGYGRLAYRLSQLTSQYEYVITVCTDSVMVSLEACNTYIRSRGPSVTRRTAIALPEALPSYRPFDLAIAIHSLPEMTRIEIAWWIETLSALRVKRVFIVPHNPEWTCEGGTFRDIVDATYRQTHHWRGPDCWPRDFYLFELR